MPRPRALPTISNQEDLISFFARWKNTLRQSVRAAAPPPPPFNFKVIPGVDTHALSWSKVQYGVKTVGQLGNSSIGPDGYEILRSFTGDFSTDLTVIPIRDINQISFVDTVGATTKAHYRIHTTSGTDSQPHSVRGTSSGIVATTTGSGVTSEDAFTSDQTRALTRKGRYKVLL